ncbi:MAG: hypothetical protein JXA30_07765 [Deltaproteobacteria bacterium]|nr:hypothetical protein [Deltaproteobacteria bacterium]
MINLEFNDEAFDIGVLDSPGGFLWWYLDLVDKAGNGAVLIWAFGLPFLEGKKEGITGLAPRYKPSICLAVYKTYRQFFYLLQEYPYDSAATDASGREVIVGKNRFRTLIDETGVSFSADIETPVPGCRRPLTGSVTAQGNRLRGPAEADAVTDHQWRPMLANAVGRVELRRGADPIVDLTGRVYLDSNFSRRPLDQLGIDRWSWMRVAFDDRELVFFDLEPRDRGRVPKRILLSVDSSGRARIRRIGALERSRLRISSYGLSYHRDLLLCDEDSRTASLRLRPPVDTSPFYLRFLVDAVDLANGERGHGIAELIKPDRIAIAAIQPFVQMRVHKIDSPNSLWLPLFSGSKSHRVQRLMAYLKRASPATGEPT